jgi:hypothetical protein
MITDFVKYLIEANLALILFVFIYKVFISQTTHFEWVRWYLLSNLAISVGLPTLPIPNIFESDSIIQFQYYDFNVLKTTPVVFDQRSSLTSNSSWDWTLFWATLYCGGVCYRLVRFIYNLLQLRKIIATARPTKSSVYLQSSFPTFSFFNRIFLDTRIELTPKERAQVIHHEHIHIQQGHTFDLLFAEVVCVIFWFNPAIYSLKKALRLTHEYVVDAVLLQHYTPKHYGQLLLKLTTNQPVIEITPAISNSQLINRITMFTKPKSSSAQKMRFLLALPVLVFALGLSSFWSNERLATDVVSKKPLPILKKITWKGNKLYTDEQLNQALGLKIGDGYDEQDFDKRMDAFEPTSVPSLYMDKGYLFYHAAHKVYPIDANTVEIVVEIFEGETATINAIIIKGNKKIDTEKINNLIDIPKGNLFSRTKIIRAQRTLYESGYFNPKNIRINPLPIQTPNGWTVDIEFVVEEI